METSLLLLLPISLFLLLLLSRHLLRSPPSRLPPSPPSLPFIGHLHHLLSSMPHHALARLSTQLATPLLYLRLGRVPTLVVSSPHLAREVLKTHDHAFASRPRLLSAQYLSFNCSDVTFSPLGPYWRQARRICVSELLSSRRVASFSRLRTEEVDRMMVSVAAESGSACDVSTLFLTLANDLLCRVAFGRRFNSAWGGTGSDRKRGGEVRKGLPEVLEETQRLFAGFDASEFFPGLGWVNVVTRLTRRLERNLRDLRAVCDEIIEDHLRRGGGGGGGGGGVGGDGGGRAEDFVDVLLRVQKSADLEVPITDDNLKALVLDMFVAGTDTTSATLEWVMTELARHPRVMKKAQEEVRGIMAETKVEESQLPQLHYMKAIIKETMRLHPPVPLLVPRESIEDCVLDGYLIPAKTRVLINTYAMGRDPKIWDDPLEYRPERFEGTGSVDLKGQLEFQLLPFGGGRRGCPGYSFALATIELALARLLYHFDWELPAGILPENVDLSEIFGLATRKRDALILVPTISRDHEFKG